MEGFIALGAVVVWKSPTSWCVHLPGFLSATDDLSSRVRFMQSGLSATMERPIEISQIVRGTRIETKPQSSPTVFWMARESAKVNCHENVHFEAKTGDLIVCCDVTMGFESNHSFCVCLFK